MYEKFIQFGETKCQTLQFITFLELQKLDTKFAYWDYTYIHKIFLDYSLN